MLEEGGIIPLGYEACHYCCRLRPKECFSRFQRHLTAARQQSICYDYATWNPKKHYCLDCGVTNNHYPTGKKIDIGFLDPGRKSEAIIPCGRCRILIDYHRWDFRFCPDCIELIRADELNRPWIYDPCFYFSHLYSEMAALSDGKGAEEVTEPEYKDYENAEPGSLLALIGERLPS